MSSYSKPTEYTNLNERRAHLNTLRYRLAQEDASYNEYQAWLRDNPYRLWASENITVETDESPDGSQNPLYIHPNLPHLDVITHMWLSLRKDGLGLDDVTFTPYAKTEQPSAEQVTNWALVDSKWFDVGTVRHHVTGATSSIAYARDTQGLLAQYPYLEELIQMVDLNDQTGCLKVGEYPLARLIREAYKVGVDQDKVIKLTMQWLDTYAEVAENGLSREDYEAELDGSKVIIPELLKIAGKECRELSLHQYIVDMRMLKTNAYVIKAIAMKMVNIDRRFKALKAKVPAEFEWAVANGRYKTGSIPFEYNEGGRTLFVHTYYVGGLDTHESQGGYVLGTKCPHDKRAHVVIVWTGDSFENPGRFYIFTRKGRNGQLLIDISGLYDRLVAAEAHKRGILGADVNYFFDAKAFNGVMNGSAALCDTRPTCLDPVEVYDRVAKIADFTELGLKVTRPKPKKDDRRPRNKGKRQ